MAERDSKEDGKDENMSVQTIKVSIILSGKYSRHDSTTDKVTQTLKYCPCCGCDLLPLLDRKTSSSGDLPALSNSPPGGPASGGRDRAGHQESDGGAGDGGGAGGGWYCGECGTQLLCTDKSSNMLPSTLVPDSSPNAEAEDNISQANTDSLRRAVSLTRLGKVLDEEYQTWEDRLQSEFQDFLISVRNHFQQKEKNLQEYQIDLCQREKELQNSEEIYQRKMSMLQESENEMKERMDAERASVTLQLQNRIDDFKSQTREVGVQTEVHAESGRLNYSQYGGREPVPQVQNREPQQKPFQLENLNGSYGLYIRSPPNANTSAVSNNFSSPPGPHYPQQHYRDNYNGNREHRQPQSGYFNTSKSEQPTPPERDYNTSKSAQRVATNNYPETQAIRKADPPPPNHTSNQRYPSNANTSGYQQHPDHRFQTQGHAQQPTQMTKQEYQHQPSSQNYGQLPNNKSQQPRNDYPQPYPHQGYPKKNYSQPQDNQQGYALSKPPNSSFNQSSSYAYPSANQLESPDPNDRSSNLSSRSSNIPMRGVTSSAAPPNISFQDQPDGAVDQQQTHRARLRHPPPPPGSHRAFPQRFEKRSQSAEMLDVGFSNRAQSPSPDRENQRSFSADNKTDTGSRSRLIDAPRAQSAERLLDSSNGYGSHYSYGYNQADQSIRDQSISQPTTDQNTSVRQDYNRQESPSRKQVPPYNGPPAYTKHAAPQRYTSPPSMHSRESSNSVNGQGEGAIIESRTLEVQVARSKSVTDSNSNIPSPKEKSVKFGVAVYPSKADPLTYPKSPFPRGNDEAEPDMTSTPVEEKEVVFPEAAELNQGPTPNKQSQSVRPNSSYGYSPQKTPASRIATPPSRLATPGYRYSGASPAMQGSTPQKPDIAAKPSPQSRFGIPASNLRRPMSTTPNRKPQIMPRSGGARPEGRIVQDEVMHQQSAPQNYGLKTGQGGIRKEINNNRPISDYADDDVFVPDPTQPTTHQQGYESSKLRQPGKVNPRNITSHHKSRIAQTRGSLQAPINSHGIPVRGIPQPTNRDGTPTRGIPQPQQPEPQQPSRRNPQYNYNQNNGGNTSMNPDDLSSSILSSANGKYFDFSPTHKALYNKYHSPDTMRRRTEEAERRKRQQETEEKSREQDVRSPSWRSRSRLPNYGKYISEIQEVPVPTQILDK